MVATCMPILTKHLFSHHRFLLKPLLELDQKGASDPRTDLDKGAAHDHIVVILLDALDEACDGSKGFESVNALIAQE